jgi:hypothetical protein
MRKTLESLEPDNYPSINDEPLSAGEWEVLAHWRRFHPDLVRGLQAEGPDRLETAVRAAWWRMEYQIAVLLAQNAGRRSPEITTEPRAETALRQNPRNCGIS